MSMSKESAKTAVQTSAFIVVSIWAYRRLSESDASPPGHFLTGFFFTYITLAILAEAAPPVGGMFAWLVAAGDVLTNGKGLVDDLNKSLKKTSTYTKPAPASRSAKGG